ncbi:hypothetical protein COT97_05125 [Candidatus Falkowbacteria bacterium CG10_big_fil_rev_8_21_14_0_10_39_11]|uniref:Chromosome partition protein Smc n=1 Tax=Candidatus Falkowbacteria bacterium CG10_big_fil_rev_8_21_14_0_10_39_11 TaxID=1974565 RepID=A0A2H0V5N8_9BACT|nr:MAG: hypothetical protein COT97_05125 [Candidatus Falkowbacteria bacterium CG10_big_fil_rev_8_21_14_0_10_39_11]
MLFFSFDDDFRSFGGKNAVSEINSENQKKCKYNCNMYLKRLEIQGFKSFANKTVLEFPEHSHADKNASSVTAIVGPNGSGKSNTADAIRWVLGEQSVKALRGKKTEDIIFSGSETKARLGFAEVSLHLDNFDKKAPIDYTEIVITRRVYRDGDGEYLINKNKVRLYDILMLLAKANFGQKTYSIVGQGMVDHIINISPWERKEFFDEATGVKQYQIKRDQSVNKLNRSKDNLEQTNQILAELEPRLRLLTRQIKKLEKRKEIEKQLRDLQKKYYANIWAQIKKDKQKYDDELSIKTALKEDLDSRMITIQTKLAGLAREESRKDIFNQLQKDYNKLQQEKNDILKELSMIKGKMSLEYTKVGKQNLSWLEDKKEEINHRVREVRESLHNLEVKVKQKRQLLEEKGNKFAELRDEAVVLENNLRSAEDSLVMLKGSGKQESLFDSVRAILRQKDYIKGIYGTLSELGNTQEIYEAALSVAAGGRLSAVVVQSDEVAVKCIQYLKLNKLGPVTFLPLNKLNAREPFERSRSLLGENGAIGFAVELLSFDPVYKKAFHFVFGSTIIVDNVNHAKDIGVGQERMVTLDGDIFEKTGVMRGGYQRRGVSRWKLVNQDNRLVSQEEKMREVAVLKAKLEEKNRQKEKISEEISDLRVDSQVTETKLKALSNDLDDLQKEEKKIQDELTENKLSPKDQGEFMAGLEEKKKKYEKILQEFEDRVLAVRNKIDQFNLDEEKKKHEVFQFQDEMQQYQSKLNEVNGFISNLRISLAKIETKTEDLDKEVRQEFYDGMTLDQLKAETVVNLEQMWFEIGKLKQNLEQIGGIDPEIIDEHEEVAKRYEFLSTQVNDLEAAIVDLEKIVGELDEVIDKQFNASFKKINKSFEEYFTKIFQGGKAKLTLLQKEKNKKKKELIDDNETIEESADAESMVDEDEDKSGFTQTGVDIYVSPPNKKLNTISALSGGERTMTSLALLCAIIESNPAPFVVMDEVDAALDEANSERFAQIIQDLSYKTQFVLITHNRVIMHVADVLYGVAMGDDGVSKTLSLDLKEAEKSVKQVNENKS